MTPEELSALKERAQRLADDAATLVEKIAQLTKEAGK